MEKMTNDKFELVLESKEKFYIGGEERTMYRIRALKDIPKQGVKKGDLGGWVEHERNLSPKATSWIFLEAKVCGYSVVQNGASVTHQAKVYGASIISDRCRVSHNAIIDDSTLRDDVLVLDDSMVTRSMLDGKISILYDSKVDASSIFGHDVTLQGKTQISSSRLFVSSFTAERNSVISKTSIGSKEVEAKNILIKGNARLIDVTEADRKIASLSIGDESILKNLRLSAANVHIGGYAFLSGSVNLQASTIEEFVYVSTKDKTFDLKFAQLNGDIQVSDENAEKIALGLEQAHANMTSEWKKQYP